MGLQCASGGTVGASRTVWNGRPEKVTALYAKAARQLLKYPSTAGHVKPGVNPGGPPPKAKYSWTTDSAIVARAKGEKNPGEGSEIEPETVYLQAVEGLWLLGATANGVPFA